MIDGNKIQNNTLDKQSVNACDSSPDEMQTPEEFKAKVWRTGLRIESLEQWNGGIRAYSTERGAWRRREKTIGGSVRYISLSEPYEQSLEDFLDYARSQNAVFARVLNENDIELDRWEFVL